MPVIQLDLSPHLNELFHLKGKASILVPHSTSNVTALGLFGNDNIHHRQVSRQALH